MDRSEWRTAADPFTDAELEDWAMEPPEADARMRWAAATVQDALGSLRGDYNLDVYVQGGYANRTAVTAQSDIDVIAALAGTGVTRQTVKLDDAAALAYRRLRRDVHDMLRARLDRRMPEPRLVCRLEVEGYEIDVLPCLAYTAPDDGPDGIWFWRDDYVDRPEVSWPRKRTALIEERDAVTDGAFRPVVRALKGARDELWEGEDRAQGFVVETLALLAAPAGRGRRQAPRALPPGSPGCEERHPRRRAGAQAGRARGAVSVVSGGRSFAVARPRAALRGRRGSTAPLAPSSPRPLRDQGLP